MKNILIAPRYPQFFNSNILFFKKTENRKQENLAGSWEKGTPAAGPGGGRHHQRRRSNRGSGRKGAERPPSLDRRG